MNREQAEKVVAAIVAHYRALGVEVAAEDLFLADHHHEGLKPGNWSIACEGVLPYEWTIGVADSRKIQSDLVFAGLDVLLEPFNNCILYVYDESKQGQVKNESPLHSGSMERESGQREVFWGRWNVRCLTRWYELDKDTTVKVIVFLADVVGFNHDPDSSASDFYRYAAELHRDEDMVAQCEGALDPTRLVPSIGGETVELLAWEAALGHAERMIMEESRA